MKQATLTEAKTHLSALIDQVRDGETILILNRGRPVAQLVSAMADDSDAPESRVARLERQGVLRRASAPKTPDLLKGPPVRAAEGVSIVEALIDERRHGR